MEDWLDRLAGILGEATLDEGETIRLLSVSREVAHRVERRITPLSTFLVGAAAGRMMADGATRDEALGSVLGRLESLLPEAPTSSG